MRATTDEGMTRLRKRFEEVAAATAAVHDCSAEVDWMQAALPLYPPVLNDAGAFAFAMDVATRCVEVRQMGGNPAGTGQRHGAPFAPCKHTALARLHCRRLVGEGDGRVGETEATMAAEDFAFIARAVPSCLLFLGIRNETAGAVHGLHTPRFTLDEGVLKLGAALHTALASQYLAQAVGRQGGRGSGGAREVL